MLYNINTGRTDYIVVNIHVARSKKITDFQISAFISFPYSQKLVNLMRSQPIRYWHSDIKQWEVPYEYLKDITDYLEEDYKITVDETIPESMLHSDSYIDIPSDYVFKTPPFEHQLEGIRYGLNHKKFLLGDEQGLGKALDLDTKVYTPNGYKLMRDIQVGDYVLNKQGKPVKVLATYDNKNVNMCEITFSDGVKIKCCEDHLWEINTGSTKKIVDTKWFFKDDQFGRPRSEHLYSGGHYKYYIDRCEPVEFTGQEVPLDPYILGCLLGDGGLSTKSVRITIADQETHDNITSKLPKGYILSQPESLKPIGYLITKQDRHSSKENVISMILKNLGLKNVTSHTKFIPDIYKYNSPEVRLELVKGLIDTDGYADKSNLLSYTTVSPQLAEDMRFMLESLGCIVNLHKNTCGYNGKITGESYNLTIRCDDPSMLCTLSKKRNRLEPRKFKPRRNIVGVTRIGKGDAKCITVDDEQGLYLIEHFVVTHNTKQMIDLACINKQLYGYKHCLIIACVNGLKYNWQEEIYKHSNESGYILGTRINKKGVTKVSGNKERLEDLKHLDRISDYFIITNIESLRFKFSEKIPCKTKGKNGKVRYKSVTHYPIVEELQKLIKSGEISMIVADEIHKCKDSTSLQGRALLSLNADSVVALSGTPLMNNAIDLYTPLKFIGFEKHSLYSFKNHYCICGGFGGHTIVGYKNLTELQTILDKCMLRRLKKSVLDLPDKIYINDYVEMSTNQRKIYTSVLEDLRQNIDKVKLSPNPLTMLIRLRQATGNPSLLSSSAKDNPKFDRLLELVEEVVGNGKKAIVFSNWTDVLCPAYELLNSKGYEPALYTGLNKDDRESEKDRFQNDPHCKVICGTIGAMGTGLTLTAGTTVIFLDEPWNRGIKDQAEDRAHRIGTTESPNIITIMCKDSIDEKIHNIVYRKGKMSDIIVDKEEDLFKNPQIINYLLS